MRIDSHQHFWRYNSTDYVWMSDAMDSLRRDYLPADLAPLLQALDFDGSIAVQARQMLVETEWLLDLADAHSSILGVVGWVDFTSNRLDEELERLAARPKLRGVRELIHDMPDPNYAVSDAHIRGVSRLRRYGLTYDLLLRPVHRRPALELVRKFPDQPFVVDHLAKPRIAAGELSPWQEEITALAQCENVYCKLSGMATEAKWRDWQPSDFRPYFDVVLESFGADRVMIGSDWPVCTLSGSYADVMGIVTNYVDELSNDEKAAILGVTCTRFYGLVEEVDIEGIVDCGESSETPMLSMHPIDMIVIVGYLVGMVLIGIYAARHKSTTGHEYFLAGRSLSWPVVGSALFASNISTIHLVGLAESGYKHGLVIGNFEWMATFTLMLLALVFIPFYFKSQITTLPEYLEKRYSRLARTILAVMAIVAALLIHIGISLYAGAAVFQAFFGLNVVASIVIISIVTAIYTVFGGLTAVVVTETIQTVILLAGAVIVTMLAIMALPSVGVHNFAEFQAATKPDQLSMIHASNRDGFAWYAILFGYPVLGIWYWCTDQTIVQRALGAKDQLNAQNGALFAGLLKISPVFLMVLPGILGYILFKDRIGENASQTLPVMLNALVPIGLKGIVAAALLAALMSTVASALNSAGTLMAIDIVKHFRPSTTDRQQVFIGRVTAVVVMILAMAWSTQGGKFGSIFEAINKMPAQFLAPPITVVFVWGVFWRRGTKQAALTTLILGFILGFIVFLIDLPAFGTIQWISDPVQGLGISFMMQAVIGFLVWSTVFVIISLATPAPLEEQVRETTWPNPLQVITGAPFLGFADPRLLSGVLFVFVVGLYCLFR